MSIGLPVLIGSLFLAIIIDLPHQAQTHILLLSNPKEFNRFKNHYFISALVIGTFCFLCAITGNIIIPVTLWSYWLIYHIITQHSGIAALYAKKNGYSKKTTEIKNLILLGTFAPMIYRMADTGISFETPIDNIKIITPSIPMQIPLIMYVIFIILLFQFILNQLNAYKKNEAYPKITYGIIAFILIIYNGFFLMNGNLLIFLVLSTLLHAIQYHLVASDRTIQLMKQAESYNHKTLLSIQNLIRAFVNNKAYWILALIFASTLVFLSNSLTYGVIPLTWAMQHFYLDGIIWKNAGIKVSQLEIEKLENGMQTYHC
jgi:hypothetical protein